ncbi:hypothetical protein, partial [Bacillus cereus]|uniref:hypothetical protein n=1 Tax=Bacillus cereus TaxID=1396 RepID=UPI00397FADD5
MPLEKDPQNIRTTEKEWEKKEAEETKTRREEWEELIKESDLTDKIKDLFSPGKDEDWTEEEKNQLDDVLEKAPPLQKDMQIYVNMQDNNLTKNETENSIKNEFYTRGNEGNINGAIDTVGPGVNFITLTAPKGEKMAYIEEGEKSLLLLRRNATYRITKIVPIRDASGNSHKKYEAELVPKEEKALDFKNDVEKARK